MRFAIVTLLLTTACGSPNENTADPSSSTNEPGTTSDDACTPGYEGCACVDSACLAGLVCLSDLCVEPPMPPPTTDATTSSDPPPPNGCTSNDDCPASSICANDVCSDAWSHTYEVRVTGFSGCMQDGWGGAEMYYDAYVDDSLVLSSGTSGCPAQWPEESFVVASFEGGFVLEFWEFDTFSDDRLASLCWDTFGDGTCGPIPKAILHAATWREEWANADGEERWVELELLAVP